MQLSLKNIGKLKHAEIEINGITVIAGENNTGKSTVSRALFSTFNSFFSLEQKVKSERINSIINRLSFVIIQKRPNFTQEALENIASTLISNNKNNPYNYNTLQKDIINLCDLDIYTEKEISDSTFKDIINIILETLNITDDELTKLVLTKNINYEFNNQVSNIFNSESNYIKLQLKDNSIKLEFNNNIVKSIQKTINFDIINEAIYIDDFSIIDSLPVPYFDSFKHKIHLLKKLESKNNNLLDELINSNKLENIFTLIEKTCKGRIVRDKNNIFKFQENGKLLDIRNLSTGLKTFVILKTLLLNNAINYNGVIILDEPETHLHPQWQLLLAELIVLLQKEFNLHVLLNTHSPYFLRAIQVFAGKYEIADTCKYYLSECISEEMATIVDVSTDIEQIYKKLFVPLQQLEDI